MLSVWRPYYYDDDDDDVSCGEGRPLSSVLQSNCLQTLFSDATQVQTILFISFHFSHTAWESYHLATVHLPMVTGGWGGGRRSLKIRHWSVNICWPRCVNWIKTLQWPVLLFFGSHSIGSHMTSHCFHKRSMPKRQKPRLHQITYLRLYSDWQTFSKWTKNTTGVVMNMQWELSHTRFMVKRLAR